MSTCQTCQEINARLGQILWERLRGATVRRAATEQGLGTKWETRMAELKAETEALERQLEEHKPPPGALSLCEEGSLSISPNGGLEITP